MKRLLLFAGVVMIVYSGHLRAGKGSILTPSRFTTKSIVQDDSTVLSGLQSNVIVEIRTQGDHLVWLATGDGLSQMRDSLTAKTLPSSEKLTAGETVTKLPAGGITAMATAGADTLLVSVVTSIEEVTSGGGLALTYNSQDTSKVSWLIFDQPVDSSADSTLSWGGKTLKALPVTVSQQNVTYDLASSDDYFWIASWAGGLRRLSRTAVSSGWKRVPLPADNMSQMLCDDQYQDYELNPRDPPDGNHNHKAFSAIAYGDTVWVGTAYGINRGIVDATGCVDWEHYSFPLNGISGNWVVGLARQKTKGRRIIWAVTRVADTGGESGISYTEDDGLSWHTVPLLRGEWGYNVSTRDSLVYISTRNGLWKSNDGVNFALFKPAIDAVNNDQILDNDVYAALHDKRSYYNGGALWIGTGDGLARSPQPGSSESVWRIFRSYVASNTPYAYPNPFSPTVHNILDGDGYVRFLYKSKKSKDIKLTVMNFAMEEVTMLEYHRGQGEGALKWDGRDSAGNLVSNGVYFCNLYFDDQSHWVKLVVFK